MSNFAPVDYGPEVQADTSGIQMKQQANQMLVSSAGRLADAAVQGTSVIMRGVLHSQAAKAATEADDAMRAAKQNIVDKPEMSTQDLRRDMGDAKYEAWEKKAAVLHGDFVKPGAATVPTWAVAGDYFRAVADRARDDASKNIFASGWRNEFKVASERAAIAHQEDVARIAGHQMTAAERGVTMTKLDKGIDGASSEVELELNRAMSNSPWLSPEEKRAYNERIDKKKDTLHADVTMRAAYSDMPATWDGTLQKLRAEKDSLSKPDAAARYKNLSEDERHQLTQDVDRHIHMLQLKMGAQDDQNDKLRKQMDDHNLGTFVSDLIKGRPPDMRMFLKTRDHKDLMNDETQVRTRGFYDSAKQVEAYNLYKAYLANQKDSKEKKVSEPVAKMALTEFYARDPEGFAKAVTAPDAVKNGVKFTDAYGVPHNINLVKDLSDADFNSFVTSRYGDIRNPVRREAEENQKMAASKNQEAMAAIARFDPEDKYGLRSSGPENAGQRALVMVGIEDALGDATKRKGKSLTPTERQDVANTVMKDFIATARNRTGWGTRVDFLGGEKVGRQTVTVGGSEVELRPDEMTKARLAVTDMGLHPGAIDATFMAEKMHREFKPIIEKVAKDSGFDLTDDRVRYKVMLQAQQIAQQTGWPLEGAVRRAIIRLRDQEGANRGK